MDGGLKKGEQRVGIVVRGEKCIIVTETLEIILSLTLGISKGRVNETSLCG